MEDSSQHHRLYLYALCRSGNHAIIGWMLRNIIGKDNALEEHTGHTGVFAQTCPPAGVYFQNNMNHTMRDNRTFRVPRSPRLLLQSYEDTVFKNSSDKAPKSIIVLREFGNLLASRFMKYWDNRSKRLGFWHNQAYNQNYLYTATDIARVWKDHAKKILAGQVTGVLYDKWITDKDHRDQVMRDIGFDNNRDDKSKIGNYGGGSSFIGMKLEEDLSQYIKRWQRVTFPRKMVQNLLADKELVNLNKKLFGTDLAKELRFK